MNFEIELKELIKKEYKSVRAFSNYSNIPYSTIDNIFKRGISGVSIQVVLKICMILNIDVEKIADDKLIIKNDDVMNEILSADENKIIKNYRTLDGVGKQKADEYINDLTENPKYTAENNISDDIINELKQIADERMQTSTPLTKSK